MLLNLQHYHRPTTLAEAVGLLKKNPDEVVPLAGGTYLVASGSREVSEVVDITHLGLSFVSETKDKLRIGATTTLQEIVDSKVMKDLAGGVLTQACRETTVSRMRRNVSTIGGEVVAAALPSGVPVALLALDAHLRLVDGEEREISLVDFYRGDPQGQLRGAIITEVIIPRPGRSARAAFMRLAQLPSSIPIVQVAAVVEIEQDVCQVGRIAIGAATAKPVRASSAEARLAGRRLDEPAIELAAEEVAASLNPISDTRGSAEYRRRMSRVLTRRVLEVIARSR